MSVKRLRLQVPEKAAWTTSATREGGWVGRRRGLLGNTPGDQLTDLTCRVTDLQATPQAPGPHARHGYVGPLPPLDASVLDLNSPGTFLPSQASVSEASESRWPAQLGMPSPEEVGLDLLPGSPVLQMPCLSRS